MWNKHKYVILSFILIVVFFLVGIRLPNFAEAAGKDATAILKDLTKTVLQNGAAIPDNGQIDPNVKISVALSFGVPVKHENPSAPESDYVVKNDTASIEVGKGIRLYPANTHVSVVIKDTVTKKKIGTATFRNTTADPDDGITMDFLFDGEDEVFEDFHDVKVNAMAEFALDTTGVDPDPNNTSQQITVLTKTYDLKPTRDEVFVEKEGKVDYEHSRSVKWTVKVKREAIGKPLNLEGYKIEDDLVNTRDYVPNTFMVNGTPAVPVYNSANKKLSYEFPVGTMSPVTVEFNTELDNEDFIKKYKAKNKVHLLKGNNKLKTAEADVIWDAGFGNKTVKMYDNKPYRKEGNDYLIDWEIIFNEKSYSFAGVTIKDELKDEEFGKLGQQFVSAKLEKWNGGTWEEVSGKTWSSEPAGHIYNIGDIDYKIKLTITSKLTRVTSSSFNTNNKIKNSANVKWTGNTVGAELEKIIEFGTKSLTKHAVVKQGTKGGLYVGFDTEWQGDITPNSSINPATSYIYDCMIFDNTVRTGELRTGLTPFTLKDQNDLPATLSSNIDAKKLIPYHDRFLKWSEWNAANPSNLHYKIYKMYVDTKHIGDILEVNGFSPDNKDKNKFLFKAKQTALNILMKSETAYNIMQLVQNDMIVESAWIWPKYNAKLLKKQVFTAKAAKELGSGADAYSADKVNKDVFDDTNQKGMDNAEFAYNKEDRSLMYRISVNAAGINGIGDQIGAVEVKDKLPEGWEFVDIQPGKKFLIYEGISYTDEANADATVKAVSGPLNSAPPNLISTISAVLPATRDNNIEFAFNNIDKPYVILLKAKVNDFTKYINKQEEMTNTASLGMKNELLKSEQKASIDERFLTKNYDDTTIPDGFLTWNIEYKPYAFINPSADISLEDVLSTGIELRRYIDTGKFVFKDDNYKILEGIHDENGTFIPEGEGLTTEQLENILTYNPTTRTFTIKIPDKTKSYKISYITDIKDKSASQRVDNTVTLKEGSVDINAHSPKEYFIADAYGSGSMRPYKWIKIIKKNSEGNNLNDAEFELIPSGSATGAKLKTASDGSLEFRHLLPGSYKLKEVTAPTGYVLDQNEYIVTISELIVGFDVDIDTQGNTKVKRERNVITIENDKIPSNPPSNPPHTPVISPEPPKPNNPEKPKDPPTPTKPKVPDEPEDPDEPTDPDEPDDPDDPDEPDTPDTPNPPPSIPNYPLRRTPNPNDPESPDEIIVINDDGTPIGNFIKKKKPNGEFEYVFADDGTPLSHFLFPTDRPVLPKTGGTDNIWYYAVGIGFILAGGLSSKKYKL